MSEYKPLRIITLSVHGITETLRAMRNPRMTHDRANPESDFALMRRLIIAGDEHAKAVRGVIVWAEADFQIGWMVEFDTYRIGIETLSTSSTMNIDLKGTKGEALASVKQGNLPDVVYRRTFIASYQTLRRIYKQRRNHRHPDWQIFCDWIASLPYFNYLIMPEEYTR